MEFANTQSSDNALSKEDVFNLSHFAPDAHFNPQSTYEELNQLFNDQDREQKTILEAREILGESANNLTDSQVYDLVNEVQYLVDTWLEEFERKTFDGKTLDQLLGFDLK